MDLPDLLSSTLISMPEQVPKEATAIGFVLRDDAGQVLVVKPKDKCRDVNATFPKVQIRDGESCDAAIGRCLREKVGAEPESLFPVPGLWATGHSRTKFFTGLRSPSDDGSSPPSSKVQAVRWYSVNRAQAVLLESKNADSRTRDLGVLEALAGVCVSPYRRQLLALRELHRMGFERLRAIAYMAPSSMYWRCEYWPVTCCKRENGAQPSFEAIEAFQRLLPDHQQARYSSSSGQVPFGWSDAVFDSARVLAEKLVERLHELVFSGWGRDPEYVEWFDRVLEASEPFGVFSAFDHSSCPEGQVELLRASNDGRLETAPPGEAPEGRWPSDQG